MSLHVYIYLSAKFPYCTALISLQENIYIYIYIYIIYIYIYIYIYIHTYIHIYTYICHLDCVEDKLLQEIHL